MLRPATPLSIIFFVAFVLLLLSTLSTPVIKAIPLATFGGYNFGVLGYCKGDVCEGPRIGYSTYDLFNDNDDNTGTTTDNDWSLDSKSVRVSLASILIVHPIATFFTLVCFGLAVAAHFHGPSHSPRYLLALLIFTFPTLLVTLLALLVDILLFIPHMAWGSWIVLGATILIIASSVVTCAMRRTLVSRKARKKRIAENADMNGADYYDNLAQQRMLADQLPRADSPPPMSGSTAVDKNYAQFTAFEMKRQDIHESQSGSGHNSDDRTPLNPTRDPSVRSASSNGGRAPYLRDDSAPPMPVPIYGRPSADQSNGMQRMPSRDQYGNPIPPGAEAEMAVAPGLRHEGSQGSLRSNPSNAYSNQRGRGYGPPPRGYGPPRGGYGPPRGNYGPPRGNFGPRGGRAGYGQPPAGFRGRGRGGFGPPPSSGMMGRGGPRQRPGPPPGYEIDAYYGPPTDGPLPSASHSPQQGIPLENQFVAGPDLLIGQAIEMNERTGNSPARNRSFDRGEYDPRETGQLQPRPEQQVRQIDSNAMAVDPEQTYRPTREQWNGVGAAEPLERDEPAQEYAIGTAMSTNISADHVDPHPSTLQPSPSVLPPHQMMTSPGPNVSPQRHRRAGSDNYYEDVDPRFAQDSEVVMHESHALGSVSGADNRSSGIPNALTPGPGLGRVIPTTPNASSPNYLDPGVYAASRNADQANGLLSIERPHLNNSPGLDIIPDGARSPGAGSEASHYTSVSQRPVNPQWRPGPGQAMPTASGLGASSVSAAQRRREDVILNANPDFSLPGVGLPGRGRGRGRGGAASQHGGPMAAATTGLTPDSRYPSPI